MLCKLYSIAKINYYVKNMTTPLFQNITIIGLGLIGSSIARKIRDAGIAECVIGYNNPGEVTEKALELGIIDQTAKTAKEAVSTSDLVIICTPIGAYSQIAKEIAPYLKDGAIITDVGSVKIAAIAMVSAHLAEEQQSQFVPAHPIAGTAESGVEAGFSELFDGKRCILTPTEFTSDEATAKISEFWQKCGSYIEIISAAKHDEIYAQVSHLPQFVIFCYMATLAELGDKIELSDCLSEEFQAFTRLKNSNPIIWRDIFFYNKKALIPAIDRFVDKIKEIDLADEPCVEGADYSIFATKILPNTIATTMLSTTSNQDYAGSGFKSVTEYRIDKINKLMQGTDINDKKLPPPLNVLLEEIARFYQIIKNEDAEKIGIFLEKIPT